MGMSIDDAVETLRDTNSYGTADIAKLVAIETMRKYQKIEEAYSVYLETMNSDTLADLISAII